MSLYWFLQFLCFSFLFLHPNFHIMTNFYYRTAYSLSCTVSLLAINSLLLFFWNGSCFVFEIYFTGYRILGLFFPLDIMNCFSEDVCCNYIYSSYVFFSRCLHTLLFYLKHFFIMLYAFVVVAYSARVSICC